MFHDENSGSYSLSYGDPRSTGSLIAPDLPRRHSNNVSKRLSHFRNWLQRLQAKEHHNISMEDRLIIADYMRTHRLVTPSYHDVQDCLRSLKMQRHYLHVFSIIHCVTGERRFSLTQAHEDRLIQRFLQLQGAYAEASNRVNMLSYLYLITKFSELEGWNDMAAELPRYKSRTKLAQADETWARVCERMNWPFVHSTEAM